MSTLTIRDIQRGTCELYDLTMEELLGRSRRRVISHPRQRAMTAARLATGASFPTLGIDFGGRDHTTVLHAMSRVRDAKEGWHVVAILVRSGGRPWTAAEVGKRRRLQPRACRGCETVFTPTHSAMRYCERRCYHDTRNRARAAARLAARRAPQPCVSCGSPFVPKHGRHVFCDAVCRRAARLPAPRKAAPPPRPRFTPEMHPKRGEPYAWRTRRGGSVKANRR